MRIKRVLAATAIFFTVSVAAFSASQTVISSFVVPLLISLGGTGATSAAGALSNLLGVGHVPDNATLVTEATASYPHGLWRDDYSSGTGAPPEYFKPQTGTCAANGFISDKGSCNDTTAGDGNSWKAVLQYPLDAREWGVSYPFTLYVGTSGAVDAGNYCFSNSKPCATPAHGVSVATQLNFQGQNNTLSLSSGTFTGFSITGTIPSGGAALSGQALLVTGAGPGSTTISESSAGNCTAIIITGGAHVVISGMTLTTTCPDGSDIWAYVRGYGEVGADVILGAAPIADLDAEDQSLIIVDGGTPLTFEGNSDYAIHAADQSVVRFYGSDNIVFSGNPTYSVAFFDGQNNAHLKTGGRNFVGSFTGARYAMDTDSSIDTENNTASFPGTIAGFVSGNSVYRQAPTGCIGGAVGCSYTTPPTNIGGGNVAVSGDADDYSGDIVITTGTGASSTGVVFFVPYSTVNRCIIMPRLGTWSLGATAQATSGGSPFFVEIEWSNAGVNLTDNTVYTLTYVCN
jgi:hypothetical protein